MSDALRALISQEIERRDWSHRVLARHSGLSNSLVSKTLAGKLPPSADFCIKVAQALGESPEKFLRLAGILPASPASDDSALQELMDLARSLPPEDQEDILKYVRFRYQQRKQG
jgi:transcriptional regulator with XRE-family HTH domain